MGWPPELNLCHHNNACGYCEQCAEERRRSAALKKQEKSIIAQVLKWCREEMRIVIKDVHPSDQETMTRKISARLTKKRYDNRKR